ncbi:hypothetical protein DPMN_001555 [Dreissena polymorpha]|uniref:Uncharacterized protein n=1 Tax=Dreissena polymorpha TaxID=45954 RepID=A0A9D4RQY1_DREPO|nr:hypothetical protein DPMN_001555 [Dreissena polymorpha]
MPGTGYVEKQLCEERQHCSHGTRGRSNLPLYTDLTDKGGRTALMATEIGIATTEPRRFAQLDYRKEDA